MIDYASRRSLVKIPSVRSLARSSYTASKSQRGDITTNPIIPYQTKNKIKLTEEASPPRAPYHHICLSRQNGVGECNYRGRHHCFERLVNHLCHLCRPYHHDLGLFFDHRPLD